MGPLWWILIFVVIICVVMLNRYTVNQELVQLCGKYLHSMLVTNRYLYVPVDEVKWLTPQLTQDLRDIINYSDMTFDDYVQNDADDAKLLMMFDGERTTRTGGNSGHIVAILKTFYTESHPATLTRVMKKATFVDDMGKSIYISSVFVHPRYRNNGFGTQLLKKLVELHNFRLPLVLEAKKYNAPAIRVYENVGFEKVGEVGDEILMVKYAHQSLRY